MIPTKENKKKLSESNKKQIHKKISNSFIENALTNKTISALKITYYLATVLRDFDYTKDLNTIIIDTKDLLSYTGLTMVDIKNSFKKMQQTSITFINAQKQWEEYISLIPRLKFHLGRNRKIEIDMYSKIAKLIVEVTDKYSFLNTKELMRLKFKHSIRLLPLLEMISQFREPAIKQKNYSGSRSVCCTA